MHDPYKLQRFLTAQEGVYEDAVSELRAGYKRSHWMWFIFPQIEGLGRSEMARRFAIASLDEARAYLSHPILGARLRECSRLVAELEGKSVEAIFGDPDNMKFHSSMTLFAQAADDKGIFLDCLRKYFDSKPDALTLERLGR